MHLGEYFEKVTGYGVLATADLQGRVNGAVYARPHIMDDGTAVFIMAERLTYENLKENPWAVYVFIEAGGRWSGRRLYLRKIKEERNEALIEEICRRCDYSRYDVRHRHVVSFHVEKVLPLIGEGELT